MSIAESLHRLQKKEEEEKEAAEKRCRDDERLRLFQEQCLSPVESPAKKKSIAQRLEEAKAQVALDNEARRQARQNEPLPPNQRHERGRDR